MKAVAKYNLFKGISTVLTVGTPIITLAACSDFFIHEPRKSVSAGGMFAIFIALLFLKDKIAEKFKVPSAFLISTVTLVLLLMVESIMEPLKYVSIATMCTSGVDELTFKRFYKKIEKSFPKDADTNKFAGFMFTTTDNIYGGS